MQWNMTCFYLKLPQDIDCKSIKGSIYLYKHHDLVIVGWSQWSYCWAHNFNLHKLLKHGIKIPPAAPSGVTINWILD